MNTSVFGQDLSATNTKMFTFTLDGVSNSAELYAKCKCRYGGWCSALSHLRFRQHCSGTGGSADIMVRNPNTGSAIVTADLTNITVKFDADTAELVFRDSAGRAMGFGYGFCQCIDMD